MRFTKEMAEESAEQLERMAELIRMNVVIRPDPLLARRIDRAAKALRSYVPMRDALEAVSGLPEGFEEISV